MVINKAGCICSFILLLITGISNAFAGDIQNTSVACIQISDTVPVLGLTPPMGWNSWNWFGKNKINEEVVREVIDAMVNEGLKDAGYNYVVVDGGWRGAALGPNGQLLSNPQKFPHGMKALADYAHSKGLKFGLHTVPGTEDCTGGHVGGYGHEEVQLQQFISWGIDFIKLDLCRFEGGWDESLVKQVYTKWSNLIKQSGAQILLSISAYQFRDWYRGIGQMARISEDISTTAGGMSGCNAVFDDTIPAAKNKWNLLTVMQIADENNKWAKYAGAGYWNDPDMLVTGNQGLTNEEQKAHFALWCIMSAPLMLGNDPRNMTQDEKNIILNKDCIMIDQDTTEQGKRIKVENNTEIWAKKMQNNMVAVLLLNRDKTDSRNIVLNFDDIGITKKVSIKDVYASKKLGTFSKTFFKTIAPQSGLLILLTGN